MLDEHIKLKVKNEYNESSLYLKRYVIITIKKCVSKKRENGKKPIVKDQIYIMTPSSSK